MVRDGRFPGRRDPLMQTTVYFVLREWDHLRDWDHLEGLDRVCLEMGLGAVITSVVMSSGGDL